MVSIFIGVISGLLWGLNDVFTDIYSINALSITDTVMITLIFSVFLAWLQDTFSAGSILLYHMYHQSFKTNWRQTPKALGWLILAAIGAGPFGMVAGIMGIHYAGPVYAGVITACYPIIALILSVIFLREKTVFKKWLGVSMSVIGVILISITGAKSTGSNMGLGMIFALCAMIGWGAESVLVTRADQKACLDTSWLLAIRQLCSSISYLLILIGLSFHYHTIILSMLFVHWNTAYVLLCVLTAALSYLAYYTTIKNLGASLATTFNASFIFWAAIFSIIMGLQPVYGSFFLWGCIVVMGIYFATKGTVTRLTD